MVLGYRAGVRNRQSRSKKAVSSFLSLSSCVNKTAMAAETTEAWEDWKIRGGRKRCKNRVLGNVDQALNQCLGRKKLLQPGTKFKSTENKKGWKEGDKRKHGYGLIVLIQNITDNALKELKMRRGTQLDRQTT